MKLNRLKAFAVENPFVLQRCWLNRVCLHEAKCETDPTGDSRMAYNCRALIMSMAAVSWLTINWPCSHKMSINRHTDKLNRAFNKSFACIIHIHIATDTDIFDCWATLPDGGERERERRREWIIRRDWEWARNVTCNVVWHIGTFCEFESREFISRIGGNNWVSSKFLSSHPFRLAFGWNGELQLATASESLAIAKHKNGAPVSAPVFSRNRFARQKHSHSDTLKSNFKPLPHYFPCNLYEVLMTNVTTVYIISKRSIVGFERLYLPIATHTRRRRRSSSITSYAFFVI